jgi:GT2 family glycosyltransferase
MALRISVVIPTYRRPELLQRCLLALSKQTLAADEYEIVVADDAASEATRQQVETFAPQVHYLPVTQSHGPAAARNVGWRAARAALIAFTDDDCVPSPTWLERAVAAFDADANLSAAGGTIVVPLPARPTDFERDTSGLEQAEFATANCFCRRRMLEEVGGFDEQFRAAWREDSDLHFSILERGGRIARIADAVVVHPARAASWGVSLRQQSKCLFDALLFKKHRTLYRSRIRPGSPWDYYGIVFALVTAIIGVFVDQPLVALAALAIWFALTLRFVRRRLTRNSLLPTHVVEMIATSLIIPWLSIFWRLYGAARFRVFFL